MLSALWEVKLRQGDIEIHTTKCAQEKLIYLNPNRGNDGEI